MFDEDVGNGDCSGGHILILTRMVRTIWLFAMLMSLVLIMVATEVSMHERSQWRR